MNIIFNEKYSNVRAMARNALRGNWPAIVLAMMLYSIFTATLPAIISDLLPNAVISLRDIYPTAYIELYNQGMTDFSFVTTLYDFLLTGPFALGLSFYMLNFLRKKEMKIETLFEGFEFIVKAFALQFMIYFFTMLWTLLFIIPGIIASFRYSQAFFILADDPKKKVMDCIKESKFMMNRNKMSLFVLQLTFIGWMILAQLIGSAILLPFSFGSGVLYGILFEIIAVFASIPIFAASAYQNVATTIFYEIVSGHLVQKRPQNPGFNQEFNQGGFSDNNFNNQGFNNNSGFNGQDVRRNDGYTQPESKPESHNEYESKTYTYIPNINNSQEGITGSDENKDDMN